MDMKAIDLQFAVHKNDEAGIRQNQLMQKPRQDEALLENQSLQMTELERSRSSRIEESAKSNIKDQREKEHSQSHHGHQSGASHVESELAVQSHHVSNVAQSVHPYKGHHIDLSL
ncbi:hypothetical protein [Paenibacillus aestuarii]|uniref:Uncharacterized protein n=1 Tax=Paenibacillus aestuarii TaxID=516965 RepID=A0ABW0K6P7_9BACL|nr:hypothetical protein [Paenibacillus aestuarii]